MADDLFSEEALRQRFSTDANNTAPADGDAGSGSPLFNTDALIQRFGKGVPQRTVGGTLKDLGVAALKSAVSVPETVIGGLDLVSGGQAGKLAEAAGIRTNDASKILDDQYSDAQKQANQNVDDAGKDDPNLLTRAAKKAGAMVMNPSTIAQQTIESLGGIGVGGAVSRGLMVLPRLQAIAKAGEVGLERAGIIAGAAGEGIVSGAQTAEQSRQDDPAGTLDAYQSVISGGSGLLTGLLSFGGGKLAQKLGIHDVQTEMAKGGAKEAAQEAAANAVESMSQAPVKDRKGWARSILEGAVQEGIIEELPQSAQEQIAQNWATGKAWDDGLDKAMAGGMMTGAAMGGGTNAIHGAEHGGTADATPAPDGQGAPTRAQQLAQQAYAQVGGAGESVDHLNDLRSKIAISLAGMDDNERQQAIEHLSSGNGDLGQQMAQDAQNPDLLATGRKAVLLDPTQTGRLDVNESIRSDSGLLAQNDVQPPTHDAVADAVNQQLDQSSQQQAPQQAPQAPQQLPQNSAAYVPEPADQVQAQIDAVKQGRKPAAVMGEQEFQNADVRGLQYGRAKDPQTGHTAVIVSSDPGIIHNAVNLTDKIGLNAAMGKVLGYVNPDMTTAPQPGAAVIQQRDENTGHVIHEEVVHPHEASQIQRVPGTSIHFTTPEQALADRAAQVAQQQEPAQPQQQPAAPQAPAEPINSFHDGVKQVYTPPEGLKGEKTAFSKELVDRVNLGRPASTLLPEHVKQIVNLPPDLTKLQRVVKWATGTDLHFVTGEHLPFNGVADQERGWVALTIDNATPLQTLGHELAHALELQHPDLYAKLEDAAFARMRADRARKLHSELQDMMHGQDGVNRTEALRQIRKELVAHAIGELAQHPRFWSEAFSEIAADRKLPMIERFVQFVKEFIGRFQTGFTREGYTTGMKDMQAVTKAFQSAYREWAARFAAQGKEERAQWEQEHPEEAAKTKATEDARKESNDKIDQAKTTGWEMAMQSPFADRIKAIEKGLIELGERPDGVRWSFGQDALNGKLTEEGVKFREDNLRQRLANKAQEGKPRPQVEPDKVSVDSMKFRVAADHEPTGAIDALPKQITDRAVEVLQGLADKMGELGFKEHEINGASPPDAIKLHNQFTTLVGDLHSLVGRRFQKLTGKGSTKSQNKTDRMLPELEKSISDRLGIDTAKFPGVKMDRPIDVLGAYTEAKKSAPQPQPEPPKPVESTAPEHQNIQQGATQQDLHQIVNAFKEADQQAKDDPERVHHLFDAPKKDEIVRLNEKAKVYHKDHGWMTPEQAKAKIEEWKQHADAQGETRANANKVVLSLFDLTGKWSEPWERAGYQVYRFDIQDDWFFDEDGVQKRAGDIHNFSHQFFADMFGHFDGDDVHAILAAVPCTDFASSGARHFAAKDSDGRTVSSVQLVHATLATLDYFKPAVWAIENPVGRIEKLGGLPPWRLSFDPNDLGDPYTKKTLLWGRFNADLPIAPVEPTEGSKMWAKYGGKSIETKNARSATPEGFAYSFFMANNAIDNPAMTVANTFDRLDRNLIERAVNAGVTPVDIKNAVEDHYHFSMDDKAGNNAIHDLLDEREGAAFDKKMEGRKSPWMTNEQLDERDAEHEEYLHDLEESSKPGGEARDTLKLAYEMGFRGEKLSNVSGGMDGARSNGYTLEDIKALRAADEKNFAKNLAALADLQRGMIPGEAERAWEARVYPLTQMIAENGGETNRQRADRLKAALESLPKDDRHYESIRAKNAERFAKQDEKAAKAKPAQAVVAPAQSAKVDKFTLEKTKNKKGVTQWVVGKNGKEDSIFQSRREADAYVREQKGLPPKPERPKGKPQGGNNARAQTWEKSPFLAFLGKHGIALSLKSEFAPGKTEQKKAMVRGYGPVFKGNGLQIDELAQRAVEEGFLRNEGQTTELHEMIARALDGQRVIPEYDPHFVQQEMDKRMEERQSAMLQDDLTPDDLDESGFTHADDEVQEQIRELTIRAEAAGLDPETILEDVARNNENATHAEYQAAALEALQAALAREGEAGAGNRSRPAVAQGEEPANEKAGAEAPEGLTSPTQQDILDAQKRAEDAAKASKTADQLAENKAKADAQVNEFSLTGSDRPADANPDQKTLLQRNPLKQHSTLEIIQNGRTGKMTYDLGDQIMRGGIIPSKQGMAHWSDAWMKAKKPQERQNLMRKIMDKVIETTVNHLVPVQRWIEHLPINNNNLKQRLTGDMFRSETVRGALEKEVADKYTKALYNAVEKAARTAKLTTDEVKHWAGYWMTAKYAPTANARLILKDRDTVNQANAKVSAIDQHLQQLGYTQKQINANPVMEKARDELALAQKNLADRQVDVNGAVGQPKSRGVAGGMNNAEAAEIRRLAEGKIAPALLDEISRPIYDMLAWKKQKDLDTGRITPDMVMSWPNHPDYVPMTGDPRATREDSDLFDTGNQLNQSGEMAMNGRKDSVSDNAIDATFAAVVKSINHAAVQDFKRTLMKTYVEAKRAGVDPQMAVEPMTGIIRNSDDVIVYRDAYQDALGKWESKVYALRFDDNRITQALKKDNMERVNQALEIVGRPTRFYGRMVTQFAPMFAPINAIRDIWERTELLRVRKLYDTSGNIVNVDKAARMSIAGALSPDVWQATWGKASHNGKMTQVRGDLEEMIRLGGNSIWGDYLARNQQALEKELRDHTKNWNKFWGKIGDAAHVYNTMFELVPALSIYRSLKALNMEPKDAAAATLDLMNFKKRGTLMPAVRAFYIFAQPNATSAYNLAQYLSTKKGAVRFAAQVAVGALLYGFLRGVWGDDDDKDIGNKLDNLGNYTVERSIPVKIGDTVVKFPVGFGPPQLAWLTAANLFRWGAGRYDWKDALGESAKGWIKSVAPVSPSDIEISKHPVDWLLQSFTPTVAKPLLQLSMDQTAFGAPLTPVFKNPNLLNSVQAKRTTAQWYSDVAQHIQDTFGMDIYPDQVKALMDGYTIDPITRMLRQVLVDNPAKSDRGENVSLPVVASLVDNINDRQILNTVYYRARGDLQDAAKLYAADPEKYAAMRDKALAFQRFEIQERNISQQRRAVTLAAKGGDRSDFADQSQSIEAQSDQYHRDLLKVYLQAQ